MSWDFGSWSFGFVEVRDLTAAQDIVNETQNSMSSGAVPISFVEGRQYRFRGIILGEDGGGVGVVVLPIDEDNVFFRQPQSRVVRAGDVATLSVGVFGRGESVAQWRRDGLPLVDDDGVSGATTLELTIDPATFADAGLYDCVVDGGASDGAFLVVQPCLAGDANGNGVVDFSDLNAVLAQFGAGCGE